LGKASAGTIRVPAFFCLQRIIGARSGSSSGPRPARLDDVRAAIFAHAGRRLEQLRRLRLISLPFGPPAFALVRRWPILVGFL